MSHNPNLEPKKHPFSLKFGQRPLTKFKDYRNAIKVKLLKYDSREDMLRGTYKFVKATWADSPEVNDNASEEQMKEALDQMLSGKALQLGLETVNFIFEIGGISHIDAQQITRQRIGVTFSAQCTGDRFLNHNDVLVEESIAQDSELLKSFIHSTLECKKSYCEMADSEKVSIQAARTILPRNMETFYYMHVNLATLLFFHMKRIDDGSQTWQMNEISQQMSDEVCKIYPELTKVFEKNKMKFKFQKEASADRKNTFSTSIYIPKDDEFEYNNRDFLYPIKKIEMNHTNTPVKDMYFWGSEEITEKQYNYIFDKYVKLDKDTHENLKNLTNVDIKEKAKECIKNIENEIQTI